MYVCVRFVGIWSLIILSLAMPVESHSTCADYLSFNAVEYDLNSVAKSYIGFIDYYQQRRSRGDSAHIVDQIVESKNHVINPFANVKNDSLALRLSAAVTKIYPLITAADWRQIQAELAAMKTIWDEQSVDRAQKTTETRALIRPHIIDQTELPGSKGVLAWHEAWGKQYLAVGVSTDDGVGNGRLYIFNVADGKLKPSPFPLDHISLKSLFWIQANGRHYLIGKRRFNHQPVIFELAPEGDLKVVRIPEKLTGPTQFARSVLTVDGRDHIVAAGGGQITLYDPSTNEWTGRWSTEFQEDHFGRGPIPVASLTVATHRDRTYILGVSQGGVFIHKFYDHRFEKLHEFLLGVPHEQELGEAESIILENGRILTAVQNLVSRHDGTPDVLEVIEFDTATEKYRIADEPPQIIIQSDKGAEPSWTVRDERVLLGQAASEAHEDKWGIHFFNWDGQKLNPESQYVHDADKIHYHSAQWVNHDGRSIVGVDFENELHFLEYIDGQPQLAGILPISGHASQISLTNGHDQLFGAVTGGKTLYIFKLMDTGETAESKLPERRQR